jgi:predicted MFS family arabinose efflux permease
MTAPNGRVRPYLTLLRNNRDFTRLYAAQLISFAGDWFANVALLGLVLETTGSAAAASLVIVLQMAGFAAISPVAGVLADRIDRKRLMVGADLLRIPIALLPLFSHDAATIWIAFVSLIMLSIAGAFFEPASSAALPNLVEERDLSRANVLIGSAWGTMLAVGAGLGGLVAATLGRNAAFVIDASTFAVSAALIVGIRRSFQLARDSSDHSAHETSAFGAIADAVRFARRSKPVASFLLSKSTFGVGTGVVLMLAVFGRDVFQAGDVGIGLLFAARGLGALIGPFVARSRVQLDNRGLATGIAVSLAVAIFGYGLFPVAPSIWIAASLVLIAHMGGGAQWMLSTLGLQGAAPDSIRGRLFSFDFGLVTLTVGLSTLAAGVIAEAVEPQVAVWTMVGLLLLSGIGWIWFSRSLWRGKRG